MDYEEEREHITSYYRCIDPIENLKIRVVLKPVKNFLIPLPPFNIEGSSSPTSFSQDEDDLDLEDCTFKWQEKVFSIKEIKQFSNDTEWKKKLSEKYHENLMNANNTQHYPKKLFTYVDVDNYSAEEKQFDLFENKINCHTSLKNKGNNVIIPGQNLKHFKNINKRNIINYYPNNDFKNCTHIIHENCQRMYIMIDLNSRNTNNIKDEEPLEQVLCCLSYNSLTKVLTITPSFTQSDLNPYVIRSDNQDTKHSYYFWLYHASLDIPLNKLTKEVNLVNKIFEHQEELKKLYIDTEFFVGDSSHLYVTLLVQIISAKNFNYDNLYIHYFLKLPTGWVCNDYESLHGTTPTSSRNSDDICYFSYLFEINFYVNLMSSEEPFLWFPELFFEVLSIDRYNRFRNEGYTYLILPRNPGMYDFNLTCWRAVDKTVKSQLKRFFIGGGPELEDISYVGLSTAEKPELMTRFGFETIPSGHLQIQLSILHQSETYKTKNEFLTKKSHSNRFNSSSLLGSVNSVIEAFRKARERMLQAKKGLKTGCGDTLLNPKIEIQNSDDKGITENLN